jgi:hypothetical protein
MPEYIGRSNGKIHPSDMPPDRIVMKSIERNSIYSSQARETARHRSNRKFILLKLLDSLHVSQADHIVVPPPDNPPPDNPPPPEVWTGALGNYKSDLDHLVINIYNQTTTIDATMMDFIFTGISQFVTIDFSTEWSIRPPTCVLKNTPLALDASSNPITTVVSYGVGGLTANVSEYTNSVYNKQRTTNNFYEWDFILVDAYVNQDGSTYDPTELGSHNFESFQGYQSVWGHVIVNNVVTAGGSITGNEPGAALDITKSTVSSILGREIINALIDHYRFTPAAQSRVYWSRNRAGTLYVTPANVTIPVNDRVIPRNTANIHGIQTVCIPDYVLPSWLNAFSTLNNVLIYTKSQQEASVFPIILSGAHVLASSINAPFGRDPGANILTFPIDLTGMEIV